MLNAPLFDVVFMVGQSKQKAKLIGVRAILGVRSRVFQVIVQCMRMVKHKQALCQLMFLLLYLFFAGNVVWHSDGIRVAAGACC